MSPVWSLLLLLILILYEFDPIQSGYPLSPEHWPLVMIDFVQLRKARTKCDTEVLVVEPASSGPSSPRNSPQHGQSATSPAVRRRKPTLRNFVMYNKAPMWNDSSQVYQLDFGGRVTQESAKNFQIEFGGKQVGHKFLVCLFQSSG